MRISTTTALGFSIAVLNSSAFNLVPTLEKSKVSSSIPSATILCFALTINFKNAICPDVDTFKDALTNVKEQLTGKENHKILLYCTGGIRCEKASAYLKHNDFKDVNQLNGGIIEYSNQMKNKKIESKYIGKNFVFDYRMSETITEDIISNCHQCNGLSSRHTNCANQACHILFIQCEKCSEEVENCCSVECTKIAELPLEEQRRLRKNLAKAAPLKQFQTGVKPKLKELIQAREKTKQHV